MKCNVGSSDKNLRIIAGVIILSVGLYYRSWWGLIGLIPLTTGITQRCPLYLPAKISTCKNKK
ncbi:DUF2892 domain-containing protein [Candidatus Woesearchaeota archaeon]|nr:DUF2892 domain-containing protein [Candidatus Woesearchaeota archaeon]